MFYSFFAQLMADANEPYSSIDVILGDLVPVIGSLITLVGVVTTLVLAIKNRSTIQAIKEQTNGHTTDLMTQNTQATAALAEIAGATETAGQMKTVVSSEPVPPDA